jgi:DNA primase
MDKGFFSKLTDVCHKLLMKNEGILYYLKEHRGLSNKTISSYKIGAFPMDLRELYEKYNLDPVELREKNIVWNADHSQFKLYPVVIPIESVYGETVAIGCRTLLGDEKRKQMGIPKYRNSNYKKTFHLFGLDRAVSAIRNSDIVYVVEGYFDVITAHQKGVKNVVATCGTMFSTRQLIMLTRYTKNICLLFDNDCPGHKSAKIIMSKFENFDSDVNLTCKFTPNGYKDIDEYLMKGGDVSLFSTQISLDNINVEKLW